MRELHWAVQGEGHGHPLDSRPIRGKDSCPLVHLGESRDRDQGVLGQGCHLAEGKQPQEAQDGGQSPQVRFEEQSRKVLRETNPVLHSERGQSLEVRKEGPNPRVLLEEGQSPEVRREGGQSPEVLSGGNLGPEVLRKGGQSPEVLSGGVLCGGHLKVHSEGGQSPKVLQEEGYLGARDEGQSPEVHVEDRVVLE